METNILLENGTNELEVLEFTVAGSHYGINVAKVREIITYQNVTPVPNAPERFFPFPLRISARAFLAALRA